MKKFNPFDYPTIFSEPTRLTQPSAWVEHIPFALLLIETVQPDILVELGTHSGNSYCAFCQAVKEHGLATNCYAIDTWEGDSQAGFYGPNVFDDLKTFHDPRYGSFSKLVQSTFDKALDLFSDQSIDILHIDGLHTYQAVKHDFDNWLPKLSNKGIVLLHDIYVKRDDFGVWSLWDEIKTRFPSFEFPHGNGLGVLAVGSEMLSGMEFLFEAGSQKTIIQTFFQHLGLRFAKELNIQRLNSQLSKSNQKENFLLQKVAETNEKVKKLSQQIEAADRNILSLNNLIVNRDQQLEAASKQIDEQNQNITQLNYQIEKYIQYQNNLQDQINKQAKSLEEFGKQTQSLTIQISKKTSQITKLNNEVRQYQKTNREIVKKIQNLQKSRTWRIFVAFKNFFAKIAPENSALSKILFFFIRIITAPMIKISRGRKLNKEIKILSSSELFDAKYYLLNNPDVAASSIDPYRHYLLFGAKEGRNPSQVFNANLYLLRNPDIQLAGLNPLIHYITHGKGEGRTINPVIKNKRVDHKKEFQQTNYNAFNKALIKLLLTNQRYQMPFTETEHLAIGAMESMRNTLIRKYADYPQDKKVSIIMPTYNRANVIMDAIKSVFSQKYKNWELIIIDDKSKDNTCSLIESLDDPRIKLIKNEENLGSAASRNNGFKHISGDYICYLDSDNQFNENFLLIMVNELNLKQQFEVLYCAMNLFNFDIEENKIEQIGVRYATFNRPTLENHNYIDIGVIMHRKECIKKTKFNESMQRLADWDFLLRLTERSRAFSLPCILVDYFYNKAVNQNTNVKSYQKALAQIDTYLLENNQDMRFNTRVVDTKKLFSTKSEIRHFQTNPVSIIIPSYNCLDYLDLCLQSIHRFSNQIDYELIIVDNASNPNVKKYLKRKQKEKNIQVIFNEENRGFTSAINQGIQQAISKNDIILLNNDTLVTKGWIEAFQEVKNKYPRVGLIVPTQTVLPTEKTLQVHRPLSNKNRELDVNISYYHNNVLDPDFDPEEGYFEVDFAPFFCVYIPRDTIEGIGLLDSKLGTHYYSDHFYCDSVRELLKRKIIYTPKSKVYHFIQQSTKEIQKSKSELSKNLMKKNW